MTCEATLASCKCKLDSEHEGPHVCECKGSWDDSGEIYAWPSQYLGDDPAGAETALVLSAILDELFPLPLK